MILNATICLFRGVIAQTIPRDDPAHVNELRAFWKAQVRKRICRAVESGVHSLEHCNLIQPETASYAAARGAYAVPTLVTYDKLASEGASLGFPAATVAKVDTIRIAGMESLSMRPCLPTSSPSA